MVKNKVYLWTRLSPTSFHVVTELCFFHFLNIIECVLFIMIYSSNNGNAFFFLFSTYLILIFPLIVEVTNDRSSSGSLSFYSAVGM